MAEFQGFTELSDDFIDDDSPHAMPDEHDFPLLFPTMVFEPLAELGHEEGNATGRVLVRASSP